MARLEAEFCLPFPTEAEDLTRANFEIATALAVGIRVLVVTRADIDGLPNTDELVDLLKKKLCQLVVSGTNFL